MRKYFILVFAFLTTQALASEPPPGWHQDIPAGPANIEGVPVSGRLDSVSVADVLQAITALRDIGVKSSELVVVSGDEMHGYEANRDLGWFTAKRTKCVWTDHTEHPCWDAFGQGLPELKQPLHFIKSAQEVYIFPVVTPLEPHRDDAHMRLLGKDARDELADIFKDDDIWMRGLNSLMYPSTKDQTVGLLFRDSDHELVLFYQAYGRWTGTFDGEHLTGDFDPEKDKVFDAWEHKYAQAELGFGKTQ
ncbi:MAG TPA: hypothetical protein VF651_07355 [Gammaproteobacteria bacterium]